jgi:hypothetical protein
VKIIRTIAHALIALGLFRCVALVLPATPGWQGLTSLLGAGAWYPLSIGLALGLNNQRVIAIITLVAVGIHLWPTTTEELIQLAIPYTIGIAIGTIILRHLQKPKEEPNGQPAPPAVNGQYH